MYPQSLVTCPHCHGQMVNDGTLNGQIVACPHCHGQFQMPGGVMPPPQASYAAPTFGPSSGNRTALKQKQETDPFAFFCFITGLVSLAFFPEVLMPICYGCGTGRVDLIDVARYGHFTDPRLPWEQLQFDGPLPEQIAERDWANAPSLEAAQ